MGTVSPTPSETDPTPRRATSVYRYYDARDVLLYVGITSRGRSRNSEHNRDKDWWPFVARQDVEHYPTRAEALAAEKDLIRRYRPPFNTVHNADYESLRETYLAYVASVTPSEDAPAAPPRRPARPGIPLDLVHNTEKVSLWRSRTGDALTAARLVHNSENPITYRNGKHRANIVAVDGRGPIVLVQLSHSSPLPDGVLYARLRCVLKRPSLLEIKSAVWLTHAEALNLHGVA